MLLSSINLKTIKSSSPALVPIIKNDNCYVEQKNYTHVRELFGYQRIEARDLVPFMNDIYVNYWNPLQNYFLPSFKLKDKIRIGARIKKVYGTPQNSVPSINGVTSLNAGTKASTRRKETGFEPL